MSGSLRVYEFDARGFRVEAKGFRACSLLDHHHHNEPEAAEASNVP